MNNFDVDGSEIQKTIIDEMPVTPSVATATMAPFSTDLNDVFISVKTTKHYHYSRLPSIIATWFQHAKDQVCLFTFLLLCRLLLLLAFAVTEYGSFLINLFAWFN